MKLQPSIAMWRKWNSHGNTGITPLLIASTIADILAGYHVAYSASELCLELKLIALAPHGKYRITKQGKLALSAHLHHAHHGSTEPLIVVPPTAAKYTAVCQRCGSEEHLLDKREFQFGGDFGGPLLTATMCFQCMATLHDLNRGPERLAEFQSTHPELFTEWSL